MANPDHVEILNRGADERNKWRKENPDVGLDQDWSALKRASAVRTLRGWISASLRPASSIQLEFFRCEGNHVVDFIGVRKQHHQAVDAQGVAGGRGHVV